MQNVIVDCKLLLINTAWLF